MTGAMVSGLRNSRFAYANPWILLFGSLGLLVGTQMVSYQSNPILKHMLYGGFLGAMALSMVPLINMASLPIIYDAMLATGLSVGGLGAIAYFSPSE